QDPASFRGRVFCLVARRTALPFPTDPATIFAVLQSISCGGCPMGVPRKLCVVALLALALGMAVTVLGCSHGDDPWEGLGGPPRVLVSFPPLYCFAKNVGGEDAAVLSLLQNQGPHDYEPTAEDSRKVVKANLFLINGLG